MIFIESYKTLISEKMNYWYLAGAIAIGVFGAYLLIKMKMLIEAFCIVIFKDFSQKPIEEKKEKMTKEDKEFVHKFFDDVKFLKK